MNPKIYCIKSGEKSSEVIARVQKKFPKFSKAAFSLASRPWETGVTLSASASRCMTGKKENRSLPCRVTFRCSPLILSRLTEAKDQLSVSTNQELMGYIVKWFLEEMEKAAPTGGTVEAAKANIARPV